MYILSLHGQNQPQLVHIYSTDYTYYAFPPNQPCEVSTKYILLLLQHQRCSTRLNTVYVVISARWIFHKLPFGRTFCIFNFTNGSLVMYISIIQKYIREDIYFREGQLPHKECIRYISRTQLQLTLSTLLNRSACWLLHVLAYKKALHPFCKRESAITTQPSCSKKKNSRHY